MGEWIHVILTSVLVGGEWSASRPGRFIPGERASDIHWIGGWVGPELVWTTWRRENSLPHGHPNSDLSVVQPVATVWEGITCQKVLNRNAWNGHSYVLHNRGDALIFTSSVWLDIAGIKTYFNLQEHVGPGMAFYALLRIWKLESQPDDRLCGLMFDVTIFSIFYSQWQTLDLRNGTMYSGMQGHFLWLPHFFRANIGMVS
jgi:hypothetical protein